MIIYICIIKLPYKNKIYYENDYYSKQMKMRIKTGVMILCCIAATNMAISQKHYTLKPNTGRASVKEDSQNKYNAENISTLDILKALELLDINISKVALPKTDKECYLGVTIDEYAKDKLIKSDTIWLGNNTYVYWERGDTTIYKDFIDEMTIMTKETKEDSIVQVRIERYSGAFTTRIKYKPENKDSFYNIRDFIPQELKYGEKIPMIAIASSWFDPKHNMTRFCGALKLSMDNDDTQSLLNNSPNYYIVSYIINQP